MVMLLSLTVFMVSMSHQCGARALHLTFCMHGFACLVSRCVVLMTHPLHSMTSDHFELV